MTDDEIATMKSMWDAGCSGKVIARELHYSTSNIFVAAHRHRDMFPMRSKRIPDDVREMWVARIMAGKTQPYQVAKKLGVSKTSVYNWLREAREKEDE